MHEKILIPKDSYVDIQQDDVDGKTYITVTVEPKRGFEPIDGDFVTIEINGDFPFSDECKTKKLIGILRGKLARGNFSFGIYAGINLSKGLSLNCEFGYYTDYFARTSTEEEKQELLDKLANIGKRWNADKKCVEDIPQRKFKAGDKVKLIKGKKADRVHPTPLFYRSAMDSLIGKKLTVTRYSIENSVLTAESGYYLAEDWLEPWSDEPKVGDWVIAWNKDMSLAVIGVKINARPIQACRHVLNNNNSYKHAIKFDGTVEQFEKVRKAEI